MDFEIIDAEIIEPEILDQKFEPGIEGIESTDGIDGSELEDCGAKNITFSGEKTRDYYVEVTKSTPEYKAYGSLKTHAGQTIEKSVRNLGKKSSSSENSGSEVVGVGVGDKTVSSRQISGAVLDKNEASPKSELVGKSLAKLDEGDDHTLGKTGLEKYSEKSRENLQDIPKDKIKNKSEFSAIYEGEVERYVPKENSSRKVEKPGEKRRKSLNDIIPWEEELRRENFSSDLSFALAKSKKFQIETKIAIFLNNFSKNTKIEYKRTLKRFFDFWADRGKKFFCLSELTKDHLVVYSKYLEEEKFSNNYRCKTISILSSFAKYLYQEDVLDRNIGDGINKPKKVNQKETAALSDYEVKLLLENFDLTKKSSLMHRAILATGIFTGLRSEELRNIQFKDIDRVGQVQIIRAKIKGGKIREVPISDTLFTYLKPYLDMMEENGFCDPNDYLFSATRKNENKKMSSEALRKIFKAQVKKAGIHESFLRRYSPHSMRSTVITKMLDEGVPIERVQEIVGHRDIGTTKLYDKKGNDPEKSALLDIKF